MKFWVTAPGLAAHRGAPQALDTMLDVWIQGAVHAEELGFDGYTATEHHFVYNDWMPSPMQSLSAVAAATSKIKLITAAMLYTLYDPAEAMEAASTLDILSGGRVSLGLGMGYRPHEFDGMGFEKKTRGARLTEAMEIMRLGTGNDSFSYEGKHHQFQNREILPRSVQDPVEMWFCGGTRQASARRAGKSGFNYYIAVADYESCANIITAYKAEARNAGFDDSKLRMAMLSDWFVGDTVNEAEEMRDYYLHEFYNEHIRAYGYLVDDEGKQLFWPEWDHPACKRFIDSLYCGTPEMIIEQIQRYKDLGIEAITVPPLQMDIFAKDIMPAFK